MVNSLENIDKSKVSADRIEGLDAKIQAELSTAVTGAASTIITSDLTANKILVSNANGKVAASSDALSNYVKTSGNQTIAGTKTFSNGPIINNSSIYLKNSENNSTSINPQGSIELIPLTTQTFGGFIDFHYAGSSTDNTSRIIEDASGQININGAKFPKTAPSSVPVQPTDTTTTTGKQIATTGWVNTRLQDIGGGSSRNIGEIVSSTVPLTDAGLHLLDGSLIQGSGSYANFVTYIAGLVSSYPDLFCSEVDWQTAVGTYGVCGKFVYTSGSPKTVRLPKFGNQIYTTEFNFPNEVPVYGNGIAFGVTDGTNNYGLAPNSGSYIDYRGGAYGKNVGISISGTAEPNGKVLGVTSDANNSGIIADLSNIELSSLDTYYYICIANSTKTDIEVDIDEVMTDLAGKADIDLSNCTGLETVHVVTETYQNGTDWYRLYDDGWIEQGGFVNIESHQYGSTSVSLLKNMIDTNYTILLGGRNNTQNGNYVFTIGTNYSTSGFDIWDERSTGGNHNNNCWWYVCGYTA